MVLLASKMVHTNANIAAVASLIKRDAILTVKNVANSVGILLGSAHKILNQQKKLRKVCAWWAPITCLKNKKAICIKMPTYFTKTCLNCDKFKLSDLFIFDGTWKYKFEPQICVSNKLWLCKDQARPVIVKEQKGREIVSYAIFV